MHPYLRDDSDSVEAFAYHLIRARRAALGPADDRFGCVPLACSVIPEDQCLVTAMHLDPFQAIVEQLESICRDGDLLVVMGAGPVWQVASEFLGKGAGRPA